MGIGGVGPSGTRGWSFWVFVCLLTIAFSVTLFRLVRLSFLSEMESYVPLIPLISAYLLCVGSRRPAMPDWLRRLPGYCWRTRSGMDCARSERYVEDAVAKVSVTRSPAKTVAAALWAIAALLVVGQGLFMPGGGGEASATALVLPVVSFVTAVIGGVAFFFGLSTLRRRMFPLLFLYLMVPIPEAIAHGLRVALQQGSADAAHLLFWLTGTPVYRDGMSFQLPGLMIEVAEECSGIHSSLVLLITSLIAGQLFLVKTWSRSLLVLLVVPIGLIRNGLRVVTISLLTIHVDAGVIDGPLHHRGGPVFFVFSLAMLAGVLWGLRRYENRLHVR